MCIMGSLRFDFVKQFVTSYDIFNMNFGGNLIIFSIFMEETSGFVKFIVFVQYFADRDIFCAGRVAEEDLQRVAAATGGTVQTTVNNIIDEVFLFHFVTQVQIDQMEILFSFMFLL